MPKNFYELLKEAEMEKEKVKKDDMDDDLDDLDVDEEEEEEEEEKPDEKEPNLDDVAPEGKGEYDAEDLREVIDYVYEILDKEDDSEDNDSVEEIGLDLLHEYADVLPNTVINQIVDDLKEMFEIEDSMLESALFSKSKNGKAALMAKKITKKVYKKNIKAVKSEAKKFRTSQEGKVIANLHKQIYKNLCKKTKRLHTPLGMPERP